MLSVEDQVVYQALVNVSQKVPLAATFRQQFPDEAAAITFGTLTAQGFCELKEGVLQLHEQNRGAGRQLRAGDGSSARSADYSLNRRRVRAHTVGAFGRYRGVRTTGASGTEVDRT